MYKYNPKILIKTEEEKDRNYTIFYSGRNDNKSSQVNNISIQIFTNK